MARRRAPTDEDYCSFCYKSAREVNRLLAGPAGINICDECVQLCSDIIHSEKVMHAGARGVAAGKRTLSPRNIRERLDEHIIGHDETKKFVSVAVYNHYQRIQHNYSPAKSEVELEKSNILLLGDTGTGKTLLARTLAQIVDVPFAMADATTLTEAGYVGEDVENILLKLIQAAGGDLPRAEKGIVYIDEIDKISRKSENRSITRDVSGEGVQQALLKIVEGTMANVPPQGGRKHPEQQMLRIDTSNILFICGGAFDGLEPIVSRRLGTRQIGFISREAREIHQREVLKHVEPDDLVKYGIIPELVGRLPIACVLDKLSKADFFRILQEPRNAIISQFTKQYELIGVELSFTADFLKKVVDESYEKKMGVRALRSTLEKYMTPLTYDVASGPRKPRKLVVNCDLIEWGPEAFLQQAMAEKPAGEKLTEAG